ncbi:MAG: hypothetical protein ABIQ18_23770 [Umezawaea sp.]
MWGDLAGDVGGLALFLVWLVLPALYVIVLGRSYVEQCRELRDQGCRCDCHREEGDRDAV